MQRSSSVAREHYPIAGSFRIARGGKTEASIICCTICEDGKIGRGECVPYARYDESIDGVYAAIEAAQPKIHSGIDRFGLMQEMPAGAARNAIDCALWDLEAKLSGFRAERFVCQTPPKPLITAFTISLGDPEEMAVAAAKAAHRSLLKIKLGDVGDVARMRAVAQAAPNCRLIADANEGWTQDNLAANLAAAAEYRFELIEQPLPAGQDEYLAHVERPILICADESAHTSNDLDRIAGLYDAVNIKLDKAGGLTAAIAMQEKAIALDLKIMVGCMVGTSLAMAPAVLLAQNADYVDLDGPLLLRKDREPGLRYHDSLVYPPDIELWG